MTSSLCTVKRKAIILLGIWDCSYQAVRHAETISLPKLCQADRNHSELSQVGRPELFGTETIWHRVRSRVRQKVFGTMSSSKLDRVFSELSQQYQTRQFVEELDRTIWYWVKELDRNNLAPCQADRIIQHHVKQFDRNHSVLFKLSTLTRTFRHKLKELHRSYSILSQAVRPGPPFGTMLRRPFDTMSSSYVDGY